jgi:hypothetical protein
MSRIDDVVRRGWISSALLAVVLVTVVAACGTFRIGPGPAESSGAPAAAGPTPTPQYQAPEDLVVGDCFDAINDRDDEALLAATIRRCTELHSMETIGIGTLPYDDTAAFPGSAAIERESDELCRGEFGRYVGVDFDDSRLHAVYYGPTEETWRGGDRRVLCAVEANEAAPFTKSVKDSGL